jgi:hypothetical protein
VNLREGTRRLALLLGVAGAIAGGFVSYLELQDVLSQRARHNRFEQLAKLDIVQQERKCYLQGSQVGCSQSHLPIGAQLDQPYAEINKDGIKTIFWDKDHVWNDASGVYSIETDTGQTLYPTPAPSAWLYFLAVLFPIFGFFIPWGVVRSVGWVGAGFVQPAK